MPLTKSQVSNLELGVFWFLVAAFSLPVLWNDWAPTMDGPVHLHNARLLVELWSGENDWFESHYVINSALTPNWLGHLTLAIGVKFFGAAVAEKAVLLIYILGLPIGFRFLLSETMAKSKWVVLLCFPFTYSFLFYYGFYNFHLGVVLLLLGLGLNIRHLYSRRLSPLLLALVGMLIYYSHLGVFTVYVLSVFVLNIICSERNVSEKWPARIWNSGVESLLVLVPMSVVSLWYVFHANLNTGDRIFLETIDILNSLKYFMPVKGIYYDSYHFISKSMLILFVCLSGLSILAILVKGLVKSLEPLDKFFLVMVTAFFVLLFTVPDNLGSGGLYSSRLMLFYFIFLIVLFSRFRTPRVLKLALASISIVVNLKVLQHNFESMGKLSSVAEKVVEVTNSIEPYSVVVSEYRTDIRELLGMVSYAGAKQPIVYLNNYEPRLNYFPLKWNRQSGLIDLIDQVDEVGFRDTNGIREFDRINYILVLSDSDGQGIVRSKFWQPIAKEEVYYGEDKIQIVLSKPRSI